MFGSNHGLGSELETAASVLYTAPIMNHAWLDEDVSKMLEQSYNVRATIVPGNIRTSSLGAIMHEARLPLSVGGRFPFFWCIAWTQSAFIDAVQEIDVASSGLSTKV